MAGLTDLEENIARLERATEAAREATREAHASKKDLEKYHREVERLIAVGVGDLVNALVADCAQEGVKSLQASFDKASRDVYAKVQAQVDILLNICMGRPGKHGDLRPALGKVLREWIDEQMRAVGA